MLRSGVVSAATVAQDTESYSTLPPASAATATQNIQVELDPLSGCGACSASGGCGVQWLGTTQVPVVVECQFSASTMVSVGDRVQVQLAEPGTDWSLIVLLAYGLPTIGMISGALAGYWSARVLSMPQLSETLSLAGFVVGLAGGLIAWSKAEKAVTVRHAEKSRHRIHKLIQER